MNTTKIELNENRDLTGRINTTFSFVKQNGKAIAKGLAYLVPVYIIIGIIMGIHMATIYSVLSGGAITDDFLSAYGVIIVVAFGASLISLIAVLFVTSYVAEYDESEDGLVDTSRAWSRARRSFAGSLGAGILVALAVFAGLLFCLIPGIWLAISFIVFLPAYVADRNSQIPVSAVGSISESYNLVKQDWFGSLGFIFIIGIIVMVFSAAISLPTSILQSITSLMRLDAAVMAILYSITYAISYAGSLFFSSIMYIAIAFLYYDLREKRDSTSLQRKIDSIGE